MVLILKEWENNKIPFILKQLNSTVHEYLNHLKHFHFVNFLTPPAAEIDYNSLNKKAKLTREFIEFYKNYCPALTPTQSQRCSEEANLKRHMFEEPE